MYFHGQVLYCYYTRLIQFNYLIGLDDLILVHIMAEVFFIVNMIPGYIIKKVTQFVLKFCLYLLSQLYRVWYFPVLMHSFCYEPAQIIKYLV